MPWTLTEAELNARPDAVASVKALAAGTATAEQQRISFAFIVERLCGSSKMTYWPGGEDGRRASDFAEGKRWVAIQLNGIVRAKAAAVDPHGAPPAMPGEREE